MKKTLKSLGLITLMCFSFFYTDKVMNTISEKDPLKIKIEESRDNYKINPIEAIIKDNTIIPGINGKEVNIEKSYKNMQKINTFNEKLLIFDTIYPEHRLIENKNKYIVNGNINNKKVSLIFIIENDNNVDKIIKILNKTNTISNLFIEYKYLFNNIDKIKQYKNNYIYSYMEKYTYESLIISNNIIKRITNNNPIYCLSKENNNNINICSYSDMYTILPSMKGTYENIKNNLENGNIILFDTSTITLNELSYLIDFINNKGYSIVSLENLLNEQIY